MPSERTSTTTDRLATHPREVDRLDQDQSAVPSEAPTAPPVLDPPLGPVAMVPFGRVIEFVEAHPGCSDDDVSAALFGAKTRRARKRERSRVVSILRSLAYARLIERRLRPDSDRLQHELWPVRGDQDLDVDWRLRSHDAETLRRQAEAEAKRWRDRCSVTVDDAEVAGLWADLGASVRMAASWCVSAGVDPAIMATLLGVSQGPHDLVNALAKHVGRPPFDVLDEILEVDA
jgi:hypothetical protein